VLRDPVIQHIRFNVGSVPVTSRLFERVAERIRRGDIRVTYNPSLGRDAYYYSGSNELELSFQVASRDTQRGVIVHECTHAGFDLMKASKMRMVSSEAGGYLAQCVFVCFKNRDPTQRLRGDTPAKDKKFEVAWRLAEKIKSGQQPTAAELQELRRAVLVDPDYRSIGWSSLAGFDGIGRRLPNRHPPTMIYHPGRH
jgi:hypothetical protein